MYIGIDEEYKEEFATEVATWTDKRLVEEHSVIKSLLFCSDEFNNSIFIDLGQDMYELIRNEGMKRLAERIAN